MSGQTPTVSISVAIVDDDPLVRSGIGMLLAGERDVQVVGEASSGREAIEFTQRQRPDVVLMDVQMPGMDGIAATRALTSDESASGADHLTKVLVLTTFDNDDAVYGALCAGASGFLLKSAAPTDLVTAIRRVAAGESWIDPAVGLKVISALVDAAPVKPGSSEALDRLTPRERQVLLLMAHGLSNHEIRERLVVSEATVKTHVARILMKLGARDRTQAVVFAYQNGLVVPGRS